MVYTETMKLYSRKQFLGAIIITAVAVFVLCGGAFLWQFVQNVQNNKEDKGSQQKEIAVQKPAQTETDDVSFDFQTNVFTDVLQVSDNLENYTQDELQNISVYQKCQDGVVNITTAVMGLNWFLEPVAQESGTGSGVIIDRRGYVVTNNHVIDGASIIYISLSDGTQYEGKVIGADATSDLAVVKFNPPENISLTTIDFGDSSRLMVGQKVIAIGNPFGFDRTMTTGIVSGLGRPIQTDRNTIIRDMIQTDTAINPGNSGGPLLDTQGRIIGINTSIYSTSGSSAGIGFAVPVNTAKRVVSELILHGKVQRGGIDASFVQLNSTIANYAKLAVNSGLLVQQLEENSKAAKAGLQGGTEAVRYGSYRNSQIIYLGGDVVVAIDGIAVNSFASYLAALESKKPGDVVTVTVVRERKTLTLQIPLSAKEY